MIIIPTAINNTRSRRLVRSASLRSFIRLSRMLRGTNACRYAFGLLVSILNGDCYLISKFNAKGCNCKTSLRFAAEHIYQERLKFSNTFFSKHIFRLPTASMGHMGFSHATKYNTKGINKMKLNIYNNMWLMTPDLWMSCTACTGSRLRSFLMT